MKHFLLLLVAWLLLAVDARAYTTNVWLGPNGGYWTNAANWSLARVPTNEVALFGNLAGNNSSNTTCVLDVSWTNAFTCIDTNYTATLTISPGTTQTLTYAWSHRVQAAATTVSASGAVIRSQGYLNMGKGTGYAFADVAMVDGYPGATSIVLPHAGEVNSVWIGRTNGSLVTIGNQTSDQHTKIRTRLTFNHGTISWHGGGTMRYFVNSAVDPANLTPFVVTSNQTWASGAGSKLIVCLPKVNGYTTDVSTVWSKVTLATGGSGMYQTGNEWVYAGFGTGSGVPVVFCSNSFDRCRYATCHQAYSPDSLDTGLTGAALVVTNCTGALGALNSNGQAAFTFGQLQRVEQCGSALWWNLSTNQTASDVVWSQLWNVSPANFSWSACASTNYFLVSSQGSWNLSGAGSHSYALTNAVFATIGTVSGTYEVNFPSVLHGSSGAVSMASGINGGVVTVNATTTSNITVAIIGNRGSAVLAGAQTADSINLAANADASYAGLVNVAGYTLTARKTLALSGADTSKYGSNIFGAATAVVGEGVIRSSGRVGSGDATLAFGVTTNPAACNWTTWSNLTCSTAGKSIALTNGIWTINGTLTMVGTNGNPVVLRTMTPGGTIAAISTALGGYAAFCDPSEIAITGREFMWLDRSWTGSNVTGGLTIPSPADLHHEF